jgi:hypothetical protein
MMMGGGKDGHLDDDTAAMVMAEESDQFRRRAVELERKMAELTRKHEEVEEQNERKIKHLQDEFEREKTTSKSRSDPDGIRKMTEFMQKVADDPSLLRKGGVSGAVGDRSTGVGRKGKGKRGTGTGGSGSTSTSSSTRRMPPPTDTLTMLSSQMISTLNGELESSQKLIEKKDEEVSSSSHHHIIFRIIFRIFRIISQPTFHLIKTDSNHFLYHLLNQFRPKFFDQNCKKLDDY